MIRKYHNHTLQTNPWHREEEPQNIYSNNTYVRQYSKATNFLFLFKMIAKLGWTQSNAYKTKINRELPQTMGST